MRFWLSILTVLIIDSLTKWWVMGNFVPGQSRPLVDDLMWLTYVHNHGAAFGILTGQGWFFSIAAIVVITGMVVFHFLYKPDTRLQFYLGLIAGGAMGNLIDRVRFHHVIDFFDLHWWPVFNVADIAIVCGGILLVLYLLRYEETVRK
ncbi:MAG: signal peptidase II [Deltaproteobacteria bacterium]